MGAFEDMLSQGAPEPEVNIFLPAKVSTVDKGGESTQAAGSPAGIPSGSQASGAAPEPAPQLPEGSDPDEPDDLEEFDEGDEADAAAAAAAAREMFAADPPAETALISEDTLEDTADDQDGGVEEGDGGEEDPAQPVIPRKGGGLTFEGESASLKQFPKALIDEMRKVLAVQLNDTFARDISQVSIVTAFALAVLGTDVSVDATTGHAVNAFRAADPKADAIDQRTALLLEQQAKQTSMFKAMLARLGEVVDTTTVLEIGQAYALAERTAQLDTSGVLPETLDVTQKRVILARDNIRKRVKTQTQEEKVRAGRPIR